MPRPYDSRRKTTMPPDSGKAAASSAVASAPHNVIRPPSSHTAATPQSDPASPATAAGTRKIPLPMMVPDHHRRGGPEAQTPR